MSKLHGRSEPSGTSTDDDNIPFFHGFPRILDGSEVKNEQVAGNKPSGFYSRMASFDENPVRPKFEKLPKFCCLFG
jgi:hypothetical protein